MEIQTLSTPYTRVNIVITSKQKAEVKKRHLNLSALVRGLLARYLEDHPDDV